MAERVTKIVMIAVFGIVMADAQQTETDLCTRGTVPVTPLRVCATQPLVFWFLLGDSCPQGAFCQSPSPFSRGPGICCTRPRRQTQPQKTTCPSGSVPRTPSRECYFSTSIFRRPRCGRFGFCWQMTAEEPGICCVHSFPRIRFRRIELQCPPNPQSAPCETALEPTCSSAVKCPRGYMCCPYGCGRTCMRPVRKVVNDSSSTDTTVTELSVTSSTNPTSSSSTMAASGTTSTTTTVSGSTVSSTKPSSSLSSTTTAKGSSNSTTDVPSSTTTTIASPRDEGSGVPTSPDNSFLSVTEQPTLSVQSVYDTLLQDDTASSI